MWSLLARRHFLRALCVRQWLPDTGVVLRGKKGTGTGVEPLQHSGQQLSEPVQVFPPRAEAETGQASVEMERADREDRPGISGVSEGTRTPDTQGHSLVL